MVTMQKLQSDLKKKHNAIIFKGDFSSRPDPLTFTSVAPELLIWANER